MKTALGFCLMILTACLVAEARASVKLSGKYAGEGNMFVENEGFGYKVNYEISDTEIHAIINEDYHIQFRYDAGPNHRTKVIVDGEEVGSGFCLVASCHFDFMYETPWLEPTMTHMTLSWTSQQLIVNYQQQEGRVFFEDVLTRLP